MTERGAPSDRVLVHCRLRPPVAVDEAATFLTTGEETSTSFPEYDAVDGKVVFKHETEELEYTFDSFLSPDGTQKQVYDTAGKTVVNGVLDGYNGTIMAYGQTGSGKTFTMMGPECEGHSRGIIPRVFEDIFEHCSPENTTVRLSYLQIYCEIICDLLNPDNRHLHIREDSVRGVHVPGLTTVRVKSAADCLRIISQGDSNRAVASTKLNAHSSRSHAVCMLQVERKVGGATVPSSKKKIRLSRLNLVDLAGSERAKRSGAFGVRMEELRAINLSLSALGNCIHALCQKRPHIPYRDSKLTRLLQESLGGNACTSLLLNVCPEPAAASENAQVLQFGQRAMKVPVRARINETPDYEAMYGALLASHDKTEDKLRRAEVSFANTQRENEGLKKRVELLGHEKAQIHAELLAAHAAATAATQTVEQANNDTDQVMRTLGKKFNDEMLSLKLQYDEQVEVLKAQTDRQLRSYQAKAHEATGEWNDIELQLASEKEAHLETLRELRQCREMWHSSERAADQRIAELLEELSDKERALEEISNEFSGERVKTKELSDEIFTLQKSRAVTADRLQVDFVSRDKVEELEALYTETIKLLNSRVEKIERLATQAVKSPARGVQRRSQFGRGSTTTSSRRAEMAAAMRRKREEERQRKVQEQRERQKKESERRRRRPNPYGSSGGGSQERRRRPRVAWGDNSADLNTSSRSSSERSSSLQRGRRTLADKRRAMGQNVPRPARGGNSRARSLPPVPRFR